MSNHHNLQVLLPPSSEPITIAEARAHSRIDLATENAVVQGMITAARTEIEAYLRCPLLPTTYRLFLDEWPATTDKGWWDGTRDGSIYSTQPAYIEIPMPPLRSVTHVKTYDDSDAATTWAASNYFVDTVSQPGRLVRRTGATWPTTTRVANGIEIQFIAGHAGTPASLPAPIIAATQMLTAHLFENRGDADAPMPAIIRNLIAPYRNLRL
jgi:hypothetical protein